MESLEITPKEFNNKSTINRNYVIVKFTFNDFDESEKMLILKETESIYLQANNLGGL